MGQLDVFNDDNCNFNCSGSNQTFKCINCGYFTQKILNCFCSKEQLEWNAHRTNAGYSYNTCKYCKCEDYKISQVTKIKK